MTDPDTRPIYTPDIAPRPPSRRRPRPSRRKQRGWIRRHRLLTFLLVIVLALSPVEWSLGQALTNPALGLSVSARLAEWTRDHGGASLVSWTENLWYSTQAPPTGGRPPAGAIPATPTTTAGADPARGGGLPVPPSIAPLASPAVPGEGQWHPAGRLVHGLPAVYEAFLRPDAQHTSLVAGVAWMDTTLLRARLYGGSYIPGHGSWRYTAPVGDAAARTLVSAFNSGFRMKDAAGGYYSESRTAVPLREGQASLVIRQDGSITVEAWHGGAQPGAAIASVRQNLGLLVDNGAPVAGLNSNDTSAWGGTIGNKVYVWRSGLGVTANGALIYAAGPGLNITTLADLLVRGGAVRGMELDINTDWVNLATYQPANPTDPATAQNGQDLLPNMADTPARYFRPSWARDFLTMSAR